MHPFFQDFTFFGFIHRGGDETKTENTLEAFEYSSDLGFVFMETDVQATKDGHVVIFHDASLKRMAGINKTIKELSLNDVRSIDLINGGKIPLLSETLESFPELRFNIDIKTEEALEDSVRIVKEMNSLNRTCLASFSSFRFKRIRNLAGPEACTSSGQMDIFKFMCRSVGIKFIKSKGHCARITLTLGGVPVLTKNFIEVAK